MKKLYYNTRHNVALYEDELIRIYSYEEIIKMILDGVLEEIEVVLWV